MLIQSIICFFNLQFMIHFIHDSIHDSFTLQKLKLEVKTETACGVDTLSNKWFKVTYMPKLIEVTNRLELMK